MVATAYLLGVSTRPVEKLAESTEWPSIHHSNGRDREEEANSAGELSSAVV